MHSPSPWLSRLLEQRQQTVLSDSRHGGSQRTEASGRADTGTPPHGSSNSPQLSSDCSSGRPASTQSDTPSATRRGRAE
jgi:hypothetical protein